MKTERLTYTHNDVLINADEQPMIVQASAFSADSSDASDIIVKASSSESDIDKDWLSADTKLTYSGGLLSSAETKYDRGNLEEAIFNYEGGILKKAVETQTEEDGATLRQTRTTDLTYDSEGLLIGIVETVE